MEDSCAAPGSLGGKVGASLLGLDIKSHVEEVDLDDVIARLRSLQKGISSATRGPRKAFCVEPSEIATICSEASKLFLLQPTLLELPAPITVVGDLHGQYTDLLRIFEECRYPPATSYLFLGNYISNGKYNLETIMLLLCYKLKYPHNIFLLRGNRECAAVNRVSSFYDECKHRSEKTVWKTINATFNCLPIAAVVSGRIFCVHGGLSPSLSSLDDLRTITRPTDVPDEGLLCDLLWSDPLDIEEQWVDNERGISYCFNQEVVQEFLTGTGLDMICRSHQVFEEGCKAHFNDSVVTIFSASDYCGEYRNSAAVMTIFADLGHSFKVL
ncbi:Metallo-dependent phosphatase-like protein [Aspergillus heterothallicus]